MTKCRLVDELRIFTNNVISFHSLCLISLYWINCVLDNDFPTKDNGYLHISLFKCIPPDKYGGMILAVCILRFFSKSYKKSYHYLLYQINCIIADFRFYLEATQEAERVANSIKTLSFPDPVFDFACIALKEPNHNQQQHVIITMHEHINNMTLTHLH